MESFERVEKGVDGKNWQDVTRGDMERFGKIWQIDVVKIEQDVARFDKGAW